MAARDRIRSILENTRTIAVYGMSKDSGKTAYWVPEYLAKKGYDIIPVNPTAEVILKRKSYPDLKSVPKRIDVVQVFRRSEDALEPVREAVARLARHRGTLIVYESPLRVAETSAELAAAWGDREAVLCRELTKLYEETVRSTLSGLAGTYAHKPPKGETVLVIAGAGDESSGASLEDTLKRLLGEGVSAKDAAKQASALLDVPRNEAYRMAMEIKETGV